LFRLVLLQLSPVLRWLSITSDDDRGTPWRLLLWSPPPLSAIALADTATVAALPFSTDGRHTTFAVIFAANFFDF
jgi:hypothetical protein